MVPIALIALTLVGCGDDLPAADGSVDGDAADGDGATIMLAPPSPPALPVFTPCPTGFVESTIASGVTVCEPWPTDAPRASCADHEVRFVGDDACGRLGTACPADGLPADVPATAIFVSAGATGGTGARASPFGTVAEALDAAAPGDTIAIGVGEYDELVTPPVDVTLVGACVEGTIVRSSAADIDRGAIAATGGASVTVQNLTVGRSETLGISAIGRDSTVTLSDVALLETTAVGLFAEMAGRIVGDRVLVRRTRATSSGAFGRGVSLQSGSTGVFDHLAVEGASEAGLYAVAPRTTLEIDHGSVLDVEAVSLGRGSGLSVLRGASATLRNTILDGMVDAGVIATGDDTRVVFEQVTLRNVVGSDTGLSPGRGLSIQEGAHIDAARLFVEAVRESGFVAALGTASLTDLVVADVTPSRGGFGGRGITSQLDGHIDASRVLITRGVETGVIVGAASATLQDLTITDMGAAESGLGRGITVQAMGDVTLERVHITDVIELGAFISASTLDATDLLIESVTSRPTDGAFGRGVELQADADASLTRAAIRDVRDVAVGVLADATLTASDILIEDVDLAECAASSECGFFGSGGHALGAYAGSDADLTRFVIRRPALCGVHMTEGSVITLSEGEVRGAEIGACVQNPDQPLEALSATVHYQDNEQNLDTTTLPIPGGAEDLASD